MVNVRLEKYLITETVVQACGYLSLDNPQVKNVFLFIYLFFDNVVQPVQNPRAIQKRVRGTFYGYIRGK